jgi:hypothetical protein
MLDKETCRLCLEKHKKLQSIFSQVSWRTEFDNGVNNSCPFAKTVFSIHLTPAKCPHKNKHTKTEGRYLNYGICKSCVTKSGKIVPGWSHLFLLNRVLVTCTHSVRMLSGNDSKRSCPYELEHLLKKPNGFSTKLMAKVWKYIVERML